MEATQNKPGKKGKNKGKRNIIKTPEDLAKMLSRCNSKTAMSPVRNCGGSAKSQPSNVEAGDQTEKSSQVTQHKATKNVPPKSSICQLQTSKMQRFKMENEKLNDEHENCTAVKKTGEAPQQNSTSQPVGTSLSAVPKAAHVAHLSRCPVQNKRGQRSRKNMSEPTPTEHGRRVKGGDAARAFSQLVHQQVKMYGPEPKQWSGGETEAVKLNLEEAEMDELNKMFQKVTTVQDEASQTPVSSIGDQDTSPQSELKKAETLQKGEMLEGVLQKQQGDQTDVAECLAKQAEENSKLKAALSQAQLEIQSHWRDLEAFLAMHTNENNRLKAALLQAQIEIQSRRDLEACLALQTQENYRLSAALFQAQMEIEHRQQWQEEMLRLHKCKSDLSKTLKERESAVEDLKDRLHNLQEQLAKITAEKLCFQTEAEQLNKRLQRTKAITDEVSTSHLSTTRDQDNQPQTKEVNDVVTSEKVQMLEAPLQRQKESERPRGRSCQGSTKRKNKN